MRGVVVAAHANHGRDGFEVAHGAAGSEIARMNDEVNALEMLDHPFGDAAPPALAEMGVRNNADSLHVDSPPKNSQGSTPDTMRGCRVCAL